MRNFDRAGQRSSGGFNRDRGFGGRKKFGGRDGGRPAMHRATCSECGDNCELPFKPTGDRPVFCSDCFGKQNNSEGSARSGRDNFRKSNFNDREKSSFRDKQMFEATCDKCGKQCEVPFRPTGDKPVYCNNCFDKGGNSSNKGNDKAINQYKEQFDALNAKLDRIIKALTVVVPLKEEKKEITVEKKEETLEKKSKKAPAKKSATKKAKK